LGEVFEHMHKPNLKQASPQDIIRSYAASERVGEPGIEYLNDKGKTKIDVN
jgi:hypothetical protein